MERKQRTPKHRRPQSDKAQQNNREQNASNHYLVGIARAFGGAIIFSLPLLMTMEMWWLGMYTDRLRLSLFLIFFFFFLVLLSYHAGYEETFRWKEDIRDACIAYGISIVSSGIILSLFRCCRNQRHSARRSGYFLFRPYPAALEPCSPEPSSGLRKRRKKKRNHQHAIWETFFLWQLGPCSSLSMLHQQKRLP